MTTRRRAVVLCASAAAILALCIPVSARSAQLVWNVTKSAPAGLYRIERGAWKTGDRVAVLPAPPVAADLDARGILENGKLMIKRVSASAGAIVCRKDDTVTIDGDVVAIAKKAQSDGRMLPSWQGCVQLDKGEVFLLGDTSSSYDGRYFGVTPSEAIIGRAVMLVSF